MKKKSSYRPVYQRKYRKELYAKAPWRKTLMRVQSRCSRKSRYCYEGGIKNFLSKDDVKRLWFRDKAYLMKSPSLDRVNPLGHYTIKNCRYLEEDENRARPRMIIKLLKKKYPEIYIECAREV